MILALTILDAALAIGVIVVVMMQSGKATGFTALSGGGQGFFGKKKNKDEMLARLTTWLAGSWMAVTLLLTVLNRRMG